MSTRRDATLDHGRGFDWLSGNGPSPLPTASPACLKLGRIRQAVDRIGLAIFLQMPRSIQYSMARHSGREISQRILPMEPAARREGAVSQPMHRIVRPRAVRIGNGMRFADWRRMAIRFDARRFLCASYGSAAL